MLTPVLSDSTVFAGFCCQTSLRHRLGMNSHYKLFELSKIDSFYLHRNSSRSAEATWYWSLL